MHIDDMTIGDAKRLVSMLGNQGVSSHPWRIGQAYLIRCVTHYSIGVVEAVHEHEILLSDAGWCADTGRYEEALRTGIVAEYEPSPSGHRLIGRGAIVDADLWEHEIPRKVIA